MKELAPAVAGLIILGLSAGSYEVVRPASTLAPRLVADTTANAVIEEYCVRCHNDERLRGNMSLQHFDAAFPEQNPELAEKVIRKLRAGMMPPAGVDRPEDATLTGVAIELETRLDEVAAANPNPGRRSFQRLNRAEYARSVEDLLGLTVDVDAFLPTETLSNNFDNIADVQNLSATLMEGYLRAAGHVSLVAVGDPTATASSTTYKVPRTASQLERADGAPFGTRGGVSVVHVFPADGDYVFRLELHPGPTGFLFGMTSLDEQLEISINGERVALIDIDRWMSESDPAGMRVETEPIHIRAGPQRLTAAFIQRFEGPVDDLITPVDHTLADTQIGSAYGVTTVPHLRDLSIVGPFDVTRAYRRRPPGSASSPADRPRRKRSGRARRRSFPVSPRRPTGGPSSPVSRKT